MNFTSASIQVVDGNGANVMHDGIFIESDKVCTVYDMNMNEGHLKI